jgi:hypothetical protein
MAENFHRYEVMRDAGADPLAVYRAAKDDDLDGMTCIRLLRTVFSLPLREALKVSTTAECMAADRLAGRLDRHREQSDAPSEASLGVLIPCDFDSMDRFPLRWRWTDPKWNKLPAERLEKIRPLIASRAREINERGMAFYHALERRQDLFSQILEHDDSGSVSPEAVKLWLRSLPAVEEQSVLVHWDQETAVLTNWATFCEYWDDFCYPMSDVVIWPITEEWALRYHRAERLTFGLRRKPMDTRQTHDSD